MLDDGTNPIRRRCSRCDYWTLSYRKTEPDGYLTAQCQQAADERDYKMTRGGDTCSKWLAAEAAAR